MNISNSLCRVAPLLALLLGCQQALPAQTDRLDYPEAPRGEAADVFHGVRVPDPYRWLEDLESEETKAWIRAQDELTEDFFRSLPYRDKIEATLRSIGSATTYGRPIKAGGRYFYVEVPTDRVGALYVLNDERSAPQLLVDPHAEHPDGSVSIGLATPSRDGMKLAYSMNAGLVWQEIRIMRVDDQTHYPETLRGITWSSSITWSPDHEGFYYMRFDLPEAGTEMTASPENSRIMYHRLGTEQSSDAEIFRRGQNPDWLLGPVRVSDDGAYLVIGASGESVSGTALFFRSLSESDSPVETLVPMGGNPYSFIGNDGSTFWVSTTTDAPNGRIVAIDLRRSEPRSWSTLIPEDPDSPLVRASVVGERILGWYTEDVKPRLKVFDFHGRHVDDVELPSITGYIGGGLATISGTRDDPELVYSFRNSAYPSSLFIHDTEDGSDRVFRATSDLAWDPEEIEIEQVFFQSRDATRIPMFLVYKSGTVFDGRNPTYMAGYGAGGWIMNAGFSPLALLLIENRGLVAIPGLRGGGEYGVPWHEAGARLNKQNTFSDYIAAAEWLIENGYTAADRLIAQGLSAGGTVPAAAVGQRPDLFGLSLPTWPVIEMIRFPEFTGGHYWTSEYGSPEDPAEFEVLMGYSPYHNVQEGTCYPPTLVVAGENDQAAMPMHAYKYVAALQHAQSCDNPILLDVVWGGGHLPTSSQAPEHFADYLAFAAWAFGLELEGF